MECCCHFVIDQVFQQITLRRQLYVGQFRLPSGDTSNSPQEIPGHTVQIRLQRAQSGIEFHTRPNQAEKNFVHDLLGDNPAAAHVQRVTIQPRLAPLVQLNESVLIAGLHPPV